MFFLRDMLKRVVSLKCLSFFAAFDICAGLILNGTGEGIMM